MTLLDDNRLLGSLSVPLGMLLLCGMIVGCEPENRPPMQVTILHTNDLHGKFRDTPATWKDDNPPIGGFANLSAYVASERALSERVLLLDGGDFMTGNPICNYVEDGAKGGAMVEFMNLMRYDAIALGNHEFDLGLENLEALLHLAKFPILSANVQKPEGGLTTGKDYVILERDGLRIGIIGLMTANLYGVAAPSALAGTQVFPPAEVAQEIVAKIDAKTDLIILLTHIGVDGDRELARQVQDIDIIVGGHSHTRLTEPVLENGVIIVQAGAHSRNLGTLKLTVQGDSVSAWEGKLTNLWPQDCSDTHICDLVEIYSKRVDADFGQEIGQLASAWRRSSAKESNVGNWIADCFRKRTGADFGLVNSGGIRKNMNAGPITKLDVLEILPFANALTTFECSGQELHTLLQTIATSMAVRKRGTLQMSGVKFTYSVQGEKVEVVEVLVGGKPLDLAATYHGVANDFVVFGNPQRYMGFEPATRQRLELVDSDVVMAAIESSAGPIDAQVEGRIRAVQPASATH